MIETFKVGVTLEFTGNAASALDRLIRDMERMDVASKQAAEAIGLISRDLEQIQRAGRAVTSLANAMEKLKGATTGGFAAEMNKAADATRNMERAAAAVREQLAAGRTLAVEMASSLNAAGRAGRSGVAGGGGGRGGRRQGGGEDEESGWQKSWRDSYANAQWENTNRDKIYNGQRALAEREQADRAARAAAANKTWDADYAVAAYENRDMDARARAASQAEKMRQRELRRIEKERSLNHDDVASLGMGAAMVAAPLLGGYHSAMERGIEIGHLRTQIMQDERISGVAADAAVNRAYEVTNSAPGSTIKGNLEAMIDLKNVTGSFQEAEEMLPRFARMSAMLAAMDRKRGGAGNQAFAAAKAMEIMGAMIEEKTDASGHTERDINPELLQKRLDMMSRVAVATNMRVQPTDYLGFAKQARVAGMTLSDEFTYEKLPAMLNVLGGPRAGTAMMSAFQVFQGNTMTNKTYDALASIGLADPNAYKQVPYKDSHGRRKTRLAPDVQHGIYDLELMAHDPLAWIAKAQERMETKGIHGTEAQIKALSAGSQRSTIAGMLADLLKDMPAILKEQTNIRNTPADVADRIAKNDPSAKMLQFSAAWDKLLTSLGSGGLDDAMKVLDRVTSGLNALGDWAKKNPELARVAVDTAAGLGALAAALGTLSLAVIAFGPALKLLRLLGPAAAAVGGGEGAAAVAAGAVGLGVALPAAGLALGGAAVAGAIKGTTVEREREDALKAGREGARNSQSPVNDGFDASGRPISKPDPAVKPRADLGLDADRIGAHLAAALSGATVQMDGRTVGNIILAQIDRTASRTVQQGRTGYDQRMTPGLTGASWAT